MTPTQQNTASAAKKNVTCKCAHCGVTFAAMTGAVNRASKRSARMFCGKACSGLARRTTLEEKKALKAVYDADRRNRLGESLLAKKREAYRLSYDPVQAAAYRKGRMHKHVAYCQTPEYKLWKRDYDRQHRAQKSYGEFAECFLLTQDIREECLNQQSDYEIRLAAGTLSKSQKRKRDYERFNSNQLEASIMGNPK